MNASSKLRSWFATCLLVATPIVGVGHAEATPVTHDNVPKLGSEGAIDAIESAAKGSHVRLSGDVIRIIDRDEFRLADATGSIRVFVSWDGPSLVSVGDRVVVEGVVDDEMTFGLSRPEVYASVLRLPSGAEIRFPAAPETEATDQRHRQRTTSDPSAPAADRPPVTAVADLSRGQSATVRGRISRILDTDEFRLEDETGSIRVYIGWRNRLPARVGDTVTVSGVVDDDPWPMRLELYADTITPERGDAIILHGHDHSAPPVRGDRPADLDRATDVRLERTLIAEVQPYDTVLIRGVVDRITDEDEFRLQDDSGSIRVYVGWRNRVPAAEGETVTVVGTVDGTGPGGIFREVYAQEVVLSDGRTVRLQRPPSVVGTAGGVSETAASSGTAKESTITIEQVRRGHPVALAGEVERIRDTDEFILGDETGRIRIYIGWRNPMPVAVGDHVTVFGVADDGVLPPEIYADRIVKADGEVVILRRGGDDGED